MKGWIKLHRKLLKKGWFKTSTLVHFWVYCLLKATYKPMKASVGYQHVLLKRGQFIFGRKKAAEETGLTEGQVRHCLDFLGEAGSMTVKPTNKFSIITLVNWAKYQKRSSSTNQQNGQQAAIKQPHTRRDKKNKIIRSSAPMAQGGHFISFWDQRYQKKYGSPYGGNLKKDEEQVKELLGIYSQDQLQRLAREYFDNPDPAIQNSGHSISKFHSQVIKGK